MKWVVTRELVHVYGVPVIWVPDREHEVQHRRLSLRLH